MACARAWSASTGPRSIGGPGHNEDRSRRPGHSPPPGKTVDAGALHGSASPRFQPAGTTATEQCRCDLVYRGCLVGSFGPALKKQRAPRRSRDTARSAPGGRFPTSGKTGRTRLRGLDGSGRIHMVFTKIGLAHAVTYAGKLIEQIHRKHRYGVILELLSQSHPGEHRT